MDDPAFRQIVAAESGRLARLATLLIGDRQRGRELTEVALARVMLRWRRLQDEEPATALRRVLFEVHGEWWHRRFRARLRPAPEAAAPEAAAPGSAAPETPSAETPAAETPAAETPAPEAAESARRSPAPLQEAAPAVVEGLAAMTPRQRAVALLDAEGRSEPEMVEMLGLSDRAVARSRPVVPLPELATALSTVDDPVPVDAVTARAGRIRRHHRITGWLLAAVLVVGSVALLRVAGQGPDPTVALRECPTELPGQVANSGGDLAAALVPFTPDQVYLCQYAPSGTRTDARLLDTAAGRRFVAALDGTGSYDPTAVCSQEGLTPFVLRATEGDNRVTLLAEPSGCGQVTNGVRTVAAGRDLLAAILAGRLDQDREPALQSCAGLDGQVRNQGSGLDRHMIGFTADRVVVCPRGIAATVGEVTGQDAQALAAAIDSAPSRRPSGVGCPSDQQLVVVVSGQTERVDIVMDASRTGCAWASNGTRVVELDHDTRSRLRELAQIAPGN